MNWMFEKKHEPLLPLPIFIKRVLSNLFLGLTIVAFSLVLGMMGYHHFENMNWIDSFVNTAMILSGMGPFATLETDAGKIFAGIYALFSGIIFLIVIAIVLAPIIHRFFHRFLVKDTTI
jgi:hypothetical protein